MRNSSATYLPTRRLNSILDGYKNDPMVKISFAAGLFETHMHFFDSRQSISNLNKGPSVFLLLQLNV